MSNRRRLDLIKLREVLAKPPAPRMQPDRRPRACCGSRQGFPHFAKCTRPRAVYTPVVELSPAEVAEVLPAGIEYDAALGTYLVRQEGDHP